MQKRQLTQASPPGGLFRALTAAEAAPTRETERERERRAPIGRNLFTHIHYTLTHTQIIWAIEPLTDCLTDWPPPPWQQHIGADRQRNHLGRN